MDKLQDQAHAYHLELLSCISKSNDAVDEELDNLKSTLQKHDSYFSALAKLAGLSSILAGWLSLKDILWPKH